MNNPAISDCLGTALPFVESGGASQPRQSTIPTAAELLDRNDEFSPLLKLFALYDRDDVMEFRFLHPIKLVSFQGRTRNHSVSIYRRAGVILDKPNRVVRTLIEKQHGGYNCYFSIHPRYPVKNRASRAADVKTIRCFALDVDGVTPEQRGDFLRQHELPTPTLTVNSGYGLHFYWFLSVPLSRYAGVSLFSEFVEKHSTQNQLNADPRCRDAARILRLPGTINQQKGTRPPALCEIIEVNSDLRYHPADLLPERRLLIEESLRAEKETIEVQDGQWKEWVKSRKATPTPSWLPTPTQPAPKRPSIFSIKKTHTSCISHRFGEEGKQVDAEFVKALIENYPIEKTGTRHEVAQRLLIALKRTVGQLPESVLHSIHKNWYGRNHKAMSGNTSEEASLSEFLSLWSWLWATDDPTRTGDFFGQLKISPHPARHIIPKSKRYERHRRLADIMYTASRNVGFAPDQFFMGVKDIQRVLKLASIESAWAILQVLKRSGLIVETIAGSQKTGRAARYSIPEQWRNCGDGGDGG